MLRPVLLSLACTVVISGVEVDTSDVVDGGWTKFNITSKVGPCRCVSGSGFRERIWKRICSKPNPRGGGKKCRGRRKVVRIELCDSSVCNITEEVKWGQWSQFSPCSTTCGNGTRTRWRYWNEFDPVKKQRNTETIPCDNPLCPISFSLHGKNYQLLSRLEGYKWNIAPGWKFVCNDEPLVPELLEAVKGRDQTDIERKIIEGTAMFVKQEPLNNGEEAWQYIEVDDPEEEVEILNWLFIPINNSNIMHYQKEICHLLSSPKEAENMDRGLLKIFRKKHKSLSSDSTTTLLMNKTNSKLIRSLDEDYEEDQPFLGRNVKNYRIPKRGENRTNSRRPFNWRQKGVEPDIQPLEPDLQPLEPRLSERVSLSLTGNNNTKNGSISEDCRCINGTTVFLASHHLIEQGFGVVSGKADCQCVYREKIKDGTALENTTEYYNYTEILDATTNSIILTTTPNTTTVTTISNTTTLFTTNNSSPLTTITNNSSSFTIITNNSSPFTTIANSSPFTIIVNSSPPTTIANSSPFTSIVNSSPPTTIANSSPLTTITNSSPLTTLANSSPLTTIANNDSPLTSIANTTALFTITDTSLTTTACPPPETIEERCAWLTSITNQQRSFQRWDENGDGLLTAEEWMNGRKGGRNCISPTQMKYYVKEAKKTIKRFDGDGNKTKATFLEFYAINRGTSHAFGC